MAVTSLENTVWKFNSTVNAPSKDYFISLPEKDASNIKAYFIYSISGGWAFDVACHAVGSSSYLEDRFYAVRFATSMVIAVKQNGGTTGISYSNLANGYVKFLDGFELSGDGLIAWVEANAVQVVEEETGEPTTITYNGATIHTTEDLTKPVTLSCGGKKAVTDIVMNIGNSAIITYNGKTTAVEGGKTATLQCAGKKMLTDVNVSLDSNNTYTISVTEGDKLINHTTGEESQPQEGSVAFIHPTLHYGDVVQYVPLVQTYIAGVRKDGGDFTMDGNNATEDDPRVFTDMFWDLFVAGFASSSKGTTYPNKTFYFKVIEV